jgi:hypothetical protein
MLNFETTRRGHVGSVAFRYAKAMIDLLALRSHLDMQDLNAERCQRSDERVQDSTLRGKAELDLS